MKIESKDIGALERNVVGTRGTSARLPDDYYYHYGYTIAIRIVCQ